MKIAALQSNIVWERPEENFAHLEPWIARAADAGARLIALPEMFACGFSMDTARIVEAPDGPTASFLAEQAARHGVWVGGSIPEGVPDQTRPHNTLLLVGPGGETQRYRKLHPFSYAGEHEHYRAGDSSLTFEIEGLRLTTFICYDLRFADVFWSTAKATDAYLVVANWPRPRREHWRNLLRARAIENQAWVVGVNRVGEGGRLAYAGDSAIIDPMGVTVAEASEQEALLIADLDPEAVRKTRQDFPFFGDRRAR
jgi:predicted amidohydrolase